ncbi:hypothetical protein PHYBLDRAFT_174849 [Phycomyces blakesleeanus NRRL 1555(-)]|uniref:Uncharacterized protein n=1 Tax=Phycomyces blakesleeanus (strain ATCC 8743b / DSM 1359 / FGSC 10004 / NBRC 33097 / NRRL 1555) TaxID=763407 RepID=A0A162WFM6_PHYB8|nr:hypothetical protein PHYBLDRAFT_174849 [Phycomyces blakesleeanus NRRL 1555(-)]OAD66825.1 hypothetical protein PHYBLDRAFT_174849 [Phycomyces blakesleeanus NRRL 1555(-)]|eukprot:XP_018284865.1 hypothetical protein PHYBLDRAFT_174849 [Phycomyces blakesleeanus NRRL 1555(-)]
MEKDTISGVEAKATTIIVARLREPIPYLLSQLRQLSYFEFFAMLQFKPQFFDCIGWQVCNSLQVIVNFHFQVLGGFTSFEWTIGCSGSLIRKMFGCDESSKNEKRASKRLKK